MANYAELNLAFGTFYGTKSSAEGFYYRNMGYSLKFKENYFILSIVQLSCLALFFLVTGVKLFLSKLNVTSSSFKIRLNFLDRAKKFSYNNLVFPLYMGFLYHFVFSLGVACIKEDSRNDSPSYFELISILAISISHYVRHSLGVRRFFLLKALRVALDSQKQTNLRHYLSIFRSPIFLPVRNRITSPEPLNNYLCSRELCRHIRGFYHFHPVLQAWISQFQPHFEYLSCGDCVLLALFSLLPRIGHWFREIND